MNWKIDGLCLRKIFDDTSVSLDPSIGNWNFKCKSHYWIINNEIIFAKKWRNWRIDFERKIDSKKKKNYFRKKVKAYFF